MCVDEEGLAARDEEKKKTVIWFLRLLFEGGRVIRKRQPKHTHITMPLSFVPHLLTNLIPL